MDNEYIHATIHEFKNNISRYIKLLRNRKYKSVVVKHYTRPIGMFLLFDDAKRPLPPKPGPLSPVFHKATTKTGPT